MRENRYTFEDLLAITRKLCAPDGCPWDRVQTHETLRHFALEEAYEFVDAIESGEISAIADESGDLLFQVVLHAALAERNGSYTIDHVTDNLCRKMLRRHPNVFSSEENPDWDAIKRKERNQQTLQEELQGITPALPALMRAEKVLKKTQKAGIVIPQNLPKDDTELAMGEKLFALVAQCRNEGVDPELALNRYVKHIIKNLDTKE